MRIPYALFAGNFNWVIKDDLLSLDRALEYLVGTMKGWDRWLPNSGDILRAPMLLQAFSYGLCNVAVDRDQVLLVNISDEDITLQHLEADGVIELRWPTGMGSDVTVAIILTGYIAVYIVATKLTFFQYDVHMVVQGNELLYSKQGCPV